MAAQSTSHSPNDLRLSIDRTSKHFKTCYSLRTKCEPYNSQFKNARRERIWIRKQTSVTDLNTLAHISLLTVAIATVATHSSQFYRKLKSVKRTACSFLAAYFLIFVSFGLTLLCYAINFFQSAISWLLCSAFKLISFAHLYYVDI